MGVAQVGCGIELARALRFCHHEAFPGYRVLHRDIKPSNIGFVASGALVLFDFGLAGTVASDRSRQLSRLRLRCWLGGWLRGRSGADESPQAPPVAFNLPLLPIWVLLGLPCPSAYYTVWSGNTQSGTRGVVIIQIQIV